MTRSSENPHRGGIVHTYQKFDPTKFPSPTEAPPDLVSPAFEHMLQFGSMRQLTEEELANAIRLDPGQFAGLGPSLDQLMQSLEERKRQILEKYETDSVQKKAATQYAESSQGVRAPKNHRKAFHRAVRDEQIYQLERIWYDSERTEPNFASGVLRLMEALGEKYQIDHLAAEYDFTGRESMTIPEALAILEELQSIDELLKQLDEAKENAQLAIIDLDQLSDFADPETMANLAQYQEQIQQYLKDLM